MRIDLDDLIVGFLNIAFIIFCIAGLTIWIWIEPLNYYFNQSDCSVWVDNNMVYNGKCHFVDVEPVGEYGNSKRVAIYYDVRKWHQKQKYISENVEIKDYVQ